MRMRDRHRSVVCVVLWFSVAIGPGDRLTNAEERVTPAMAADIDEFAARILATDTVPGMGVAVVTSQGIAYATGYGFADVESRRPATADTQFYIASTTKALTALAAALLHDREQLDLDAPLSQYLPDVQMHPELSAEDVALRDLLTMTHGIEPIGPVDIRTAFTGDFTYPGLQALLRHHPPAQSGRDFRYSNLGYNVFSIVLEDRFGGGWETGRERCRPASTADGQHHGVCDAGGPGTRLGWPCRTPPAEAGSNVSGTPSTTKPCRRPVVTSVPPTTWPASWRRNSATDELEAGRSSRPR